MLFLFSLFCPSLSHVNCKKFIAFRLDREIEVSVPSPSARLDILHKLLSRTSHTITKDELKDVAYSAHGFVGADLASLCSCAVIHAVKRTSSGDCLCASDSMIVRTEDILWAVTQVKPSAMREVFIEVPNVCEVFKRNVKENVPAIDVFLPDVFWVLLVWMLVKEFISEMEASVVRNCHLLISSFLVSVHECGCIFYQLLCVHLYCSQTVSCCSHHSAVVQ